MKIMGNARDLNTLEPGATEIIAKGMVCVIWGIGALPLTIDCNSSNPLKSA